MSTRPMRSYVGASVCSVRVYPGLADRDEIWQTYSYGPSTHCVKLTHCSYAYVCQTVRSVLATSMERGRQRPLHIFVHIQFWPNYCLEGNASWRAGRCRAWYRLVNIALGGQPQIGKGHSPWPKHCIKWGRCWKAGVKKTGVENAALYGR